MTLAPRIALPAIFAWSVTFLPLALGSPPARSASVTFVLRDLVFTGPVGQNGLPSPVLVSEPGIDGHLLWTYTPGDFQNGTGMLLDLALPITSLPLASAIVTVDATGITGSQSGNTHNLTYDFQLTYAHALTGPTDSSGINAATSSFDFTGDYLAAPGVAFNGEWLGNFSSGAIEPEAAVLSVPPSPSMVTSLGPPSPNPFRDAATVDCTLGADGTVDLAVHGVDGRRVATLFHGTHAAGRLRATWDARDSGGRRVPPGLYWLRLTTPRQVLTARIARLP